MATGSRCEVASKGWLIAHALLLPIAVLAGEGEAEERLDELDEVLVEGEGTKPSTDGQKMLDWLARLVGKFTYDGHVDLKGQGKPEDQQRVRGGGDCIGLGPAPAVQCTINVTWPQVRGSSGEEILGGVSTLDPAVILYGYAPQRYEIRSLLVDSKGVAQPALGRLYGDTLISRAPCTDIPGNCQKIVWTTAGSDLETIRMRIDLEIEQRKAISFNFVLTRVPGSHAIVIPSLPR